MVINRIGGNFFHNNIVLMRGRHLNFINIGITINPLNIHTLYGQEWFKFEYSLIMSKKYFATGFAF